MAKKRRRKKRWLRTLLVFIMVPLAVWFTAFLLWFFWYDIAGLVRGDGNHPDSAPKASRKAGTVTAPPTSRPEEKILNQDRKTLDDIIKKRR